MFVLRSGFPQHRLAVLAIAALALGSPVAADAAGVDGGSAALQRLDGLLLSEPPAGFEPVTGGRTPADPAEFGNVAVGLNQVFAKVGGTPQASLGVVLWDPTGKPTGTDYALATFRAKAAASEPFDASAVGHRAFGWREDFDQDGEPWQGRVAVVRHGGLIIQAMYVTPAGEVDDVASVALRDLVERQLARPTIPTPKPGVPASAAYLDDLLLDAPRLPGHTFILLPGFSGVLTPEKLRSTGTRAAYVQELAELSGQMRGVARHWISAQDGTAVRVTVFDRGSDLAAARALARVDGILDDKTDIVAREDHGGRQVTAMARRGQYLIGVVTGAAGATRTNLRVLAMQTLERQRALLPAGDTGLLESDSTDDFSALLGSLVGTLGVLAGIRLIASRRKRRRVRVRAASGAGVVSVSDESRRLRVAGLAMGGVLLVLTALALATVPFSPPISLVLLGVVPVIVVARRRWERRSTGMRVVLWRPRIIRSSLIAAVSFSALALAALFAVFTATTNTFGGGLWQSDMHRLSGGNLDGAFSVAAIALPLLAVVLFRVARRQARLRAAELRRHDKRPQVLYLRGFADDKLAIPTIVSGRRPVVELLSPFPTESYEAIVAWALDARGPTVAIAPPGSNLSSLGAAREHVGSDVEWQTFVGREMAASGTFAISLGRSEGLLWELEQLAEGNLLDRTLILFPPVGDDELRARWTVAAPVLSPATLPADPASILVATISAGEIQGYTADQRDEAGYRAAISAALASITAFAPERPPVAR